MGNTKKALLRDADNSTILSRSVVRYFFLMYVCRQKKSLFENRRSIVSVVVKTSRGFTTQRHQQIVYK